MDFWALFLGLFGGLKVVNGFLDFASAPGGFGEV